MAMVIEEQNGGVHYPRFGSCVEANLLPGDVSNGTL